MVISHRHRFIFMHCRKVAGSSVTALLNRYLGPEDLQVGAWSDTIRRGGRYNRRAIRTLVLDSRARRSMVREVVKPLVQLRVPRLHDAVNDALKAPFFDCLSGNPAHATADSVRTFDPGAWNSYTKFCFVRNPFEFEASDYHWRRGSAKGVTFTEFLERKRAPTRPDPEGVVPEPATNWPIYTIDDRIAVDLVGRYEHLERDLSRIFDEIGLGGDQVRLPRAKRGRSRGSYREMYDEQSRSLVQELHQNELEAFGYTFPVEWG